MLKKWIKPELVNIITVEAGKAVVGTEMKSQTSDNYGHKYAHAYKSWGITGLVHGKKQRLCMLQKEKYPISQHCFHSPSTSQTPPYLSKAGHHRFLTKKFAPALLKLNLKCNRYWTHTVSLTFIMP